MTILGVAAVNRDKIVLVRESLEEYEEAVQTLEELEKLERLSRDRPSFVRLGGSTVNTLYVLASCGLDTVVLGKLGVDLARWVLLKLLQYNMRFIGTITSVPTGRTIVLSSQQGQRRIYVYPGANDYLTLSDLSCTNVLSFVQRARLVHTSTFVCSRGLEPVKVQIEVMQLASRGIRSIVLGTLYTGRALRDSVFRELLQRLLEQVNVMFLSQAELQDLKKLMNIDDVDDLLSCFTNLELVFLTRGAEGVKAVWRGGGSLEQKPLPAEVLDTTGAGDAFAGGVLLGILAGSPISEAVRIGLECARSCIMAIGGTGYRLPRKVLRVASRLSKV